MNKKHILSASSALLAAAMLLTACSSDGGEAAPGDDSNATISAEAQTALDRAFEGIGSDLSDLASVEVTPGQSVWVVSCGEQVPSCAVPAAGVKSAAEKAGWKADIGDGKLNPEGFATAVRQGIAAGADLIIPIGIGCGVAQAAFKEATDAGITIIGGGGVDDCDPKLWAAERLWVEGYNPVSQWEQFGRVQADYAFGKTNGDVKAVVLNFTTQVWGQWITDGFNDQLSELGSGEVLATVDVSDPENADGSYIQKVTTALLSNPDANVLVVPIDGWLTNGLAQAIVQADLDDKLVVIGRGGDGPALDMIRAGGSGIDATVGFAVEWGAWGSVDTAIRVLAGGEGIYVGEPMQAIDAETNMPAKGEFTGGIDFKSKFAEAWGK